MNKIINKQQVIYDDLDYGLEKAAGLGATQAEIGVTITQGFSVSVREQDVENIEYENKKEIAVTVYIGKRKGSASTTDVRRPGIDSAITAACDIARVTGEDPYAGLAEKSLLAKEFPDLSLNHPWDITVEKARDMALECERQATAMDKRIKGADSVSVSTYQSEMFYANSNSFNAALKTTRHDVTCILIAKEKELMERDYGYTVARKPSDLYSIDRVAKEAVERTVKRLGAKKIKTQKAPVLFVPEVAASLLSHFISAISGTPLYQKASFLLDMLDKPVFAKHIHIHEDPYILSALGSSSFDGDGVQTRQKYFVKEGVLRNYCLSVYSARRLGMQTTANAGGVHNLLIEPTAKDNTFEKLVKTMDKGLVVTELMGQGVDIVSGNYSRGVCGFWVENGEIQFPVAEVTVASNLKDMYQGIVSVGSDIDPRSNILTGSILIDRMTVAGD